MFLQNMLLEQLDQRMIRHINEAKNVSKYSLMLVSDTKFYVNQ